MNLYKPIDYLYYLIGSVYELINMEASIRPSLPAMLAAVQIFSLGIIQANWIKVENSNFQFIFYMVGFVLLIIFNLLRYKEGSYQVQKTNWRTKSTATKWTYRTILILYFGLTLYCTTSMNNI